MGNKGELYGNSVTALEPVAFVPPQQSREELTSDYSLFPSYSMKMENAGSMMSHYWNDLLPANIKWAINPEMFKPWLSKVYIWYQESCQLSHTYVPFGEPDPPATVVPFSGILDLLVQISN